LTTPVPDSVPSETAASAPDGTVTVTTGERYDLNDAAQAQRDLEGRRTHGSTVLTP
jgi:NADPH:quinone reductase-like Zn-dependent oxidoreductase